MNILIAIILSCIFIVHLIFTKHKNMRGRKVTKPFLMPLLVVFYIMSVQSINKFIVIALMFGFLGDVFLMWSDNARNFIMGLASFLMGHIWYIVALMDNTSFFSNIPYWFFLFIIPYVIGGIFVIRKLNNYLGNMKVGTIIYAGIILLMSFTSLARIYVVGNTATFILPFIGSVLFLISDSTLAFDTFKGEIKNGNVYIMLTYVAAQVLIVCGFLF